MAVVAKDWTDFGQLPQTKGSQGNPWRRVWKDAVRARLSLLKLYGSKGGQGECSATSSRAAQEILVLTAARAISYSANVF